ncbi:GNAT family N-acetyltransferase [Streptomyces sp. NPDC060187]|uniref:GNAT family N-acetyltransferase n=1 Tax=Streptomyces sp. NPDC060187 TaxID=3347067 RepID=UPI003668B078
MSCQRPWTRRIRRSADELAPRLAPAGDARAFVVDAPDGSMAACALGLIHPVLSAPAYPRGLAARVHIVATHPGFRRLGYARAVVTTLVDNLADAEGVTLFELHASVEAQPLYRELGFTGSPALMQMTRLPAATASAPEKGSAWMPPEQYAETVPKANAFVLPHLARDPPSAPLTRRHLRHKFPLAASRPTAPSPQPALIRPMPALLRAAHAR